MLGAELSWDGITEVSLQEAWVVGDRQKLSRPQNQLVWGHRWGEKPGGLEEPREASEAEERGQ